ncbi:MAG: hypothetical protein KGJ55_02445 [Gammaproteobacteria bacterium]|nr:hypothetical protein [Gammaproteobacteria bacterium]
MAVTLAVDRDDVVGLDEFIDFVNREVDLRDRDSLLGAAPRLRALANDRGLVARRLNALVENLFTGEVSPSAQSIFLGAGEGFYVRANLWPSNADISAGRIYQDRFSYHIAHDHNYDFLTVNHFGPGYRTDIYDYDFAALAGHPGEPVQMRFLETVHFRSGMVMLYRASQDLHVQYPPEDFSISLNLMVAGPEVRLRDQLFFDLERKCLLDYPADDDASRRVSMLRLAGLAGDGNTRELLDGLSRTHPCRRTRLAAYAALAQMAPAAAAELWRRAGGDREPLVAEAARSWLAEHGD